MFAEELGGNAQRKRQEEARNRRRQLKLEQQRKEQQQKQKEARAAAAKAGTEPGQAQVSNGISSPAEGQVSKLKVTATAPSSSSEDAAKNNSAVANALQQRQLRQEAQQHRKAALVIQSFWRCYRSNKQLLQKQSTLLDQRLSDLGKLRQLLQKQSTSPNTEYCPPPALCTTLCQQLLFWTTTIPYRRSEIRGRWTCLRNPSGDFQKVQLFLIYVILPGLSNPDENVNPLLVWKQSREGRLRLEGLIRLCLVTLTAPRVPASVLDTCIQFLGGLVRGSSPSALSEYCCPILLSSIPIPLGPLEKKRSTSGRNNHQKCPHAKQGTNLDLFRIVRHQLLFGTGGPDPIPPSSEKLRADCIPAADRVQADKLFQFLLKTTVDSSSKNRQDFELRFFTEILTIPLLSWKISDHSINQLVVLAAGTGVNQKPLLIQWVETFIQMHTDALNAGDIDKVLPADISLTACPATPTQSLLANLLELSRSSPHLNGSNVESLEFSATATLFQFIGSLVDAVPVATFLSRESVVEWISDGQGHHAPVVLSPVVMEQCRMLLADGYVRKLLICAIDDNALGTDRILKTKNDKDLKHEADMQAAGNSAASLAAKEARIDRSKGFFNSSSWSKKLTKGVSKMLQGGSSSFKNAPSMSAKPNLINTSSISKKLASSGGNASASVETAKLVGARPKVYSTELLFSLVRVYAIVLSRWGGGGKDDIVGRVRDGSVRQRDHQGSPRQEVATSSPDPKTQTLLSVICFSTPLLQALWSIIQSDPNIVADVYGIIDPSKGKVAVRSLSARPLFGRKKVLQNNGGILLFTFVCALAHVLVITDDTDIHDMDKPLPLHQLRRCVQTLKKLLYRACCVDDTHTSELEAAKSPSSNYFGLALISWTSKTMRDLYDRSSRRPFCVPKMWLVEDLMEKDIRRCKSHEDYVALLSAPVLRVCPFLVSFKRRLKIFERIVNTNRIAIQGENSQNPFHTNPLKPGIPVRITRGRVLEDGLATLNKLGPNLRQRIAVQYQNEAGTRETGIDAGGLFKVRESYICHGRIVPPPIILPFPHPASDLWVWTYAFFRNSGLIYRPSHLILTTPFLE